MVTTPEPARSRRPPAATPTAGSIGWEARLAAVAGRHAPKIEKAFGYRTVGDLLAHYPRRWVPQDKLSEPERLTEGDFVTVMARVARADQKQYRDRRTGGTMHRLEVVVRTEGADLVLTFFDKRFSTAQWRHAQLQPGRSGLFSGKVGRFRDQWQLTNPHMVLFGAGAAGEEEALEALERLPALIPIYPATSTVQSWDLFRVIGAALDLVQEIPEVVPETVREQHDLVTARRALEWVHRPDTWAQQGAAVARLRFDEAFVTQTVLAQRRASVEALPAQPRTGRAGGLLDRFDERLPFRLTAGQQEVSRAVLDDLAAGHPMHRLLQGEVGSGKTVVALRAMLRVVDSGGQAALLAPTEVLAQQHHRSITSLLGDLSQAGMLGGAEDATRVVLLTGSLGAAARREALLDAASGAAGIVVGTHALLEEKVRFADLGLVVVDEQHRFGVEQRASLTDKGGTSTAGPPHVLVMTATPIPRTVAMTVFGDLETSTLSELPAGRAETQTSVVALRDHPAWMDRAVQRIREEVEAGHQVFVVCPRIGSDEPVEGAELPDDDPGAGAGRTDHDQDPPMAAVEDVAPALAGGPLHGLRVDVLHGRMAPDRKDEVMRAFAAGDVDVLVSTTVIEVGVDVPNATMMVVLDADRFGVSQLHQLRGRIGRGGLPGLCLLVTSAEQGTAARERLDAVAATTDGFELSRLDLRQRREGDVLGASQSGRRSGLRLLRVLEHEDVIAQAREAATRLVAEDPGLDRHGELAERVRRLHEDNRADYLERA